MKKLVTERDVIEADKNKTPIYIDESTIVTALAKDVAKKYNIEICFKNENESTCKAQFVPPVKESKNIEIIDESDDINKEIENDPIFSANDVYKFLSSCIEMDIIKEEDLTSL